MTLAVTHLSINSFLRPGTHAFLARSCSRVHDSYPPLSLSNISKSFKPEVSLQQVKTCEESRGTSTIRDVKCTLPARQRLSWLAPPPVDYLCNGEPHSQYCCHTSDYLFYKDSNAVVLDGCSQLPYCTIIIHSFLVVHLNTQRNVWKSSRAWAIKGSMWSLISINAYC